MSANQLPAILESATGETKFPEQRAEIKLQCLIPIAMVIVGGCETCAEKMVARALQEGSSWQDVDKTLRIIAGMQQAECFAKAVGPDVVVRMEKPLAAGRKTLLRTTVPAEK